MNRRQFILAVVVITLTGVSLRLGPLLRSPLPFNPDGIVYAGHVTLVQSQGFLPLGRLAVDELHFTSFLTLLAHITGRDALRIAQPAVAVVGAVPVLLAVAAARRIGIRSVGGTGKRVALLAGLLVAIEGLYLHRSMPVDEQTVGLLFVPLVAYALARAESARRWLVCAVVPLIVLPAVHNLDSIVVSIAGLIAAVQYLGRGKRRTGTLLLAATVGFWVYVAVYSFGIAAMTPAAVIQNARVTTVPGLFLAWVVLAAIASAWFVTLQARSQRWLLGVGLSSWFVLLAINALVPVFPGMPATEPAILVGVGLLVVPAVVAVYGLPTAIRTPFGIPFVAIVGSVFALIGLTLSASLTPDYLNTAYRAQTFVHVPVLVFAAVGVATVASSSSPSRTGWWPRILAAVIVVAAAATIPVAFAGLDVLAYKGTTTESEFAAASFAATHTTGAWASDDHISRIARYYGPNSGGSMLPVYGWLHDGARPPPCPVVSQASWTTTGAQFYPRSPVTVSTEVYESTVESRNVVYTTGGSDPLTVSISSVEDDGTC